MRDVNNKNEYWLFCSRYSIAIFYGWAWPWSRARSTSSPCRRMTTRAWRSRTWRTRSSVWTWIWMTTAARWTGTRSTIIKCGSWITENNWPHMLLIPSSPSTTTTFSIINELDATAINVFTLVTIHSTTQIFGRCKTYNPWNVMFY